MSDTSGTGGPSYPQYPGQGPPPSSQSGPSDFPPQGPDYLPPGQGYPPPGGQGYPAPGQGYPAPGQGYPPPGQGYPPPPPGSGHPGPYGPPGYPGYPGGGYGEAQTPEGWSGLAIAAFVVGLVLPLVGILVAVPLGIVALVKISGTRRKGRALAIIGIVASVLWWVGMIVLGLVLASQEADRNSAGEIVSKGRIGFGDIREGDCVSIPDPGGNDNIDTFDLKGVPCDEPHNAQAAAIISISGSSYPGQSSLSDQSLQPCIQAVSGLPGISPQFMPYRLLPTEGIWNGDSGHRVICFVTKVGFTEFTGSLAD